MIQQHTNTHIRTHEAQTRSAVQTRKQQLVKGACDKPLLLACTQAQNPTSTQYLMLLGLLLLLLLLLLLFLLLLLLQQPLLLLLVLRLNLRADGCDCHVRLKEANKHRQTESKLRAGSVDVVVGGGDGGGED